MEPAVEKTLEEFAYSTKDFLGKGAYGEVYKGRNTKTGKKVAVKAIPMEKIAQSEQATQMLTREITNMKKLASYDHPNLVKFLDAKSTKKNIYMFLEFCEDGDLDGYLKKKANNRVSSDEARAIFKDLSAGMKVLIDNKLVHRDIKPANILRHEGVWKIADFGFSKEFMSDGALTTKVGTPMFMAPQILFGDYGSYTNKCDIWSLGVLLYRCLYGTYPFAGTDIVELQAKVKTGKFKFLDEVPVDADLKELITKMLQVNEGDRLSWEEFFAFSWASSPSPSAKEVLDPEFQGYSNKIHKDLGLIDFLNHTVKSIEDSGLRPVDETKLVFVLRKYQYVTMYNLDNLNQEVVKPMHRQNFPKLAEYKKTATFQAQIQEIDNNLLNLKNEMGKIVQKVKLYPDDLAPYQAYVENWEKFTQTFFDLLSTTIKSAKETRILNSTYRMIVEGNFNEVPVDANGAMRFDKLLLSLK